MLHQDGPFRITYTSSNEELTDQGDSQIGDPPGEGPHAWADKPDMTVRKASNDVADKDEGLQSHNA